MSSFYLFCWGNERFENMGQEEETAEIETGSKLFSFLYIGNFMLKERVAARQVLLFLFKAL
ncbi:hypothetical protein [Paenibacillus larvae]|uniref:hypothetical protein n=1 Tax=Paenibacillus larvae TaxID=1464 RepID=UPI002853A2C4|nr:hypothetical protein [Paenibacillus larvae]MDR5584762.1 hypothetical protein [Paenibacillus larvae]